MKENGSVPVNNSPEQNNNQQPKSEQVKYEIDKENDDFYDKKDKDDEEMQDIRSYFNSRSFCKTFDIIFLLAFLSVFAYIWIYIYQMPIPEIIKFLFGMDDTQYPTDP